MDTQIKDKSLQAGIKARMEALGAKPVVTGYSNDSKDSTGNPRNERQEHPVIAAYREAFERRFPAKVISIRFAGKNSISGLAKFWVFIDGEKGEKAQTIEELREATAMLLRK